MYIYIHVPFCRSKCIYCDFYVVLARYGGQEAFVAALLCEIDERMAAYQAAGGELAPIETVYFGGGTPSLLPATAYASILARLTAWSPLAENPEITLEANPGGPRESMASSPEAYRAVGINRMSIGVQSLNDTELKRLSRLHTAGAACDFVTELAAAGFKNLSVDLMYGLPGQTSESWAETLQQMLSLPVQHVSMYGLKVEDTTPLARLSQYPAYSQPPDETIVAMYEAGVEMLTAGGFSLYEFSNLARPGFASRHNLNYWHNRPFFGFGPSATGYLQGVRTENVRDLTAYLDNPTAGSIHVCRPREQLENAFIFGLRKVAGVDLGALEAEFGPEALLPFHAVIEKHRADGWLVLAGDTLRLSRAAIPLSNAILADFLLGEL